jgi:hypothetical protein
MPLTPYNQTLNLPTISGILPADFDPSLWSTPELREYQPAADDPVVCNAMLYAVHQDTRRYINVAFGRDLADIIDRNPAHADWIRAAVKR